MPKEALALDKTQFGSGSFIGPLLKDPDFFDQSPQDQARLVGWANGCPVTVELTDPENTAPGRGPEAMMKRYAEINFWFGYITDAVKGQNPGLYAELTTPVERLPGEPIGKHEPESVPESHKTHMAPMGTLAGYALPRIFTKQLGQGLPLAESRDRMHRGLQVLKEAIPQAETPADLLALVAEGLSQADVPPVEALKNVLSPAWYEEHNCAGMLQDVRAALKSKAPSLWSTYESIPPEERRERGIL